MDLDSAIFYSHNINKAIIFYRDTLEMSVEYQQEDQYVSLMFKNNVRLGIKKAVEQREVPGGQTVLVAVDDLLGMYQRVQQQKVPIYKELTKESWGTNFAVLDPDGNKVGFVERK